MPSLLIYYSFSHNDESKPCNEFKLKAREWIASLVSRNQGNFQGVDEFQITQSCPSMVHLVSVMFHLLINQSKIFSSLPHLLFYISHLCSKLFLIFLSQVSVYTISVIYLVWMLFSIFIFSFPLQTQIFIEDAFHDNDSVT